MFYAQPNDLYCSCFRSYGFENLKSLKQISRITSLSQKSVHCTGRIHAHDYIKQIYTR